MAQLSVVVLDEQRERADKISVTSFFLVPIMMKMKYRTICQSMATTGLLLLSLKHVWLKGLHDVLLCLLRVAI